MKYLGYGLAILSAACAAPTAFAAGNVINVYNYQTSEYVNFAGTGPLGIASDTLPGGLKYYSIKIQNPFRTPRIPLDSHYGVEISTEPAGVPGMDTRIWMRKPDGTLIPLNDNLLGSTFSRVLVYVDYINTAATPGVTEHSVELLIAAKSTADNSGNFNIVSNVGLSYNACYNRNDPFVYMDIFGTVQVFRPN